MNSCGCSQCAPDPAEVFDGHCRKISARDKMTYEVRARPPGGPQDPELTVFDGYTDITEAIEVGRNLVGDGWSKIKIVRVTTTTRRKVLSIEKGKQRRIEP